MARNYEELIRRHRKRKTIGFIAAIVLFAGAISGTVAGFTSNAQNTEPVEITAEPTWHSRNLKELFTCGSHTFYTEKD